MSKPNDPYDTQGGVAQLPGDRTQRVPTQLPADQVRDPTATVSPAYAEGLDAEASQPEPQPVGPVKAYEPSSTELASQSRRQRRRLRDRRAERRAVQVLVALFVGLGGLALLTVNFLLDDTPSTPPAEALGLSVGAAVAQMAPPTEHALGDPATEAEADGFVETIDLPALRQLKNEGLTIVAEGLPEVSAMQNGPNVGPLAARETCRFAYGVWEFSPNSRFRFIPTCAAMDGQVLFGAYSVRGTVIRMSPLRVAGVSMVSEFEVEKPSRLVTEVVVGEGQYTLSVKQRVTVIRPGLFGESFFNTYVDRNTLSVPGRKIRPSPRTEPQPRSPPPKTKRDPLLDLLRGKK